MRCLLRPLVLRDHSDATAHYSPDACTSKRSPTLPTRLSRTRPTRFASGGDASGGGISSTVAGERGHGLVEPALDDDDDDEEDDDSVCEEGLVGVAKTRSVERRAQPTYRRSVFDPPYTPHSPHSLHSLHSPHSSSSSYSSRESSSAHLRVHPVHPTPTPALRPANSRLGGPSKSPASARSPTHGLSHTPHSGTAGRRALPPRILITTLSQTSQTSSQGRALAREQWVRTRVDRRLEESRRRHQWVRRLCVWRYSASGPPHQPLSTASPSPHVASHSEDE